jgi:hypothetical protein
MVRRIAAEAVRRDRGTAPAGRAGAPGRT